MFNIKTMSMHYKIVSFTVVTNVKHAMRNDTMQNPLLKYDNIHDRMNEPI